MTYGSGSLEEEDKLKIEIASGIVNTGLGHIAEEDSVKTSSSSNSSSSPGSANEETKEDGDAKSPDRSSPSLKKPLICISPTKINIVSIESPLTFKEVKSLEET